jgi:hypothetical protein
MELKETSLSIDHKNASNLLNALLEAQETGNIELFASCFKHDSSIVNIGTDIDEYWVGWKPFYAYMKQMIQLRHGLKITSKNTKIDVSPEADVAWYSQLIDTCIETKKDPFRLEGFRHTGVMQKVDGYWKIVQSHVSIWSNSAKLAVCGTSRI